MPRVWAVIKREFLEIVKTRLFIISTLGGPAFLVAILILPSMFMDDEIGVSRIAVIDQTPEGVGITVDALLTEAGRDSSGTLIGGNYHVEIHRLGRLHLDDTRIALQQRVEAEELDGYLWLPRGLVDGDTARYEGTNATNQAEMRGIRLAIRDAVQRERFARAGIDQETVSSALSPVAFEARKSGTGAVTGSPLPALLFAVLLTLGGWFTIINSSNSVIRAVREERRDKVVEIILSSISSRTLLFGKIIGVWGASLLQAVVWIAIGALAVGVGGAFIGQMGGNPEWIPEVPFTVPIILFVFLAGGYFLYAGLAAALTSISLSDQEASQIPNFIQWFPLPVWLFIGKVINDPEGPASVIASFIPFFAPILVPTRVALTQVPWQQLLGSALVVYLSAWLLIWVAAKLYRITIMATGQKVSLRQVAHWLRSA
jgi:ABC-2 type transport system permease protein